MYKVQTIKTNNFSLPRQINRLGELAYNLWWTWEPEAQRLFSHIDKELWESTYHNPVMFLRQVSRAQLNAVTHDRYYVKQYDKIFKAFDAYMQTDQSWCKDQHPDCHQSPIAYFSTEFGLHETLPIYAGGLGVLSGDHLKESSDLGLPIVAIGFLYTQGYFSQHISEDGWQEAHNIKLRFEDLPVSQVVDADNNPLTITVELPGRDIEAKLWEVKVGRIQLYLLDSNVESNTQIDRDLTSRLYNSDLESRISQEIILGVGGVRALRLLGYNPGVWHMNEGHSAFIAIERCRELVDANHSFNEAKEIIKKTTIFTTHTPVAAGSDEFPLWLIDKYFSRVWSQLGIKREEFIDLARREQSWGETFSMPSLAMRFSGKRNGVSELHGIVAREMWQFFFPKTRVDDIPISYITNGIHTGTWMARRLRNLYDEHLGKDWLDRVDDPDLWDSIDSIPDIEMWEVRRHLKRKLVHYIRDRARNQWMNDGVHPVQVVAAGVLLDPYALTIGFARRFATYKRADLILRDLDRLLALINKPNMPVQIIFAGKSHPADEPGKMLIQKVYRTVKKAENGGRLVFLEDYDMNLARYLVQGVDVWLNTPRRPNEASGTSGQKAALNGVLNLSILDGWWREGYNGSNGWAIGEDVDSLPDDFQDQKDTDSLYDILENEVIPLFYDKRSSDGLPGDWLIRMKNSMRTLSPQFSMRRMVKEYATNLYLPAMEAKRTRDGR